MIGANIDANTGGDGWVRMWVSFRSTRFVAKYGKDFAKMYAEENLSLI